MRAHRYLALLSSIFAFSSTGCSLMGLSDFDLPECESDQQCMDAYNAESGFPADCHAYVCREVEGRATCVNVADEEGEAFDAADNDCDGVIDEPHEGRTVIAPRTSTLTSADASDAFFSLAEVKGGDFNHYYKTQGSTLQYFEADADTASPAAIYAQYALETPANTDLAPGCYPPPGVGQGSCTSGQPCPASCTSVNDIVAAAATPVAFYAEVNTNGCAGGEIRAGVIDPMHPEQLIDRGDGFLNPIYRSINPTPGRCTISATQSCQDALDAYEADSSSENRSALTSACGASRPALAAFEEQALLAYLAAPRTRAACSGELSEIHGLGLFAGVGNFGGLFYWLNPSNDGQVESFGQTRGDAPPSVTAAGEAGFFVGFGNESGDVSLSWVPAQTVPSPSNNTTCPTESGMTDCESREGRHTNQLSGLLSFHALSSESADAVDLAWLAADEDSGFLAATWQTGCGDAESMAQVLKVRIESGVPTIEEEFPAIAIGASQAPPQVIVASDDFFASGFSRAGKDFDDSELGGFYVIVQKSNGFEARRVAAADGERVDSDEVILIGEGDARLLGKSSSRSAFTSINQLENAAEEHLLSAPGN